MSESYQAVYDAVRSRISNADIGGAVERAFRDANISHYFEMAMNQALETISDFDRPSVMFKPKLSKDGNMWCALYGENLTDGCAGFGESPSAAMWAFDTAWFRKSGTQSE